MSNPVQFEVWDGDEFFAQVDGPREQAWAEALHYASQCSGVVTIEEVVRKVVYTTATLTPDPLPK